MSFRSIPLFPGDLYDTALRLAADARPAARPVGQAHAQASEAWQQMQGLGWQGVLIAEAVGGVGGRLSDLAALVEALARHAVPVPLIDRCAVAPLALGAAASVPHVAALLESLTLGEASVCASLGAGDAMPGAATEAWLGADGQLQGRIATLDLSEPASHVLFSVRQVASSDPALVLLPFAQVAERVRHHVGVDGRQFSDVSLDGLQVPVDAVLLRGAAATVAVAQALQAGSLLAGVQAVGACASMVEQTVEYLNTRIQFGTALSTFQALRHRTVEMYVAYENTMGLIRRLVQQAESGLLDASDVALARLYAIDVGRQVSEGAIQLHGGMGMTWEMPVARLAMQTLQQSLQFGDRSQCLDWLSARVVTQTAARA